MKNSISLLTNLLLASTLFWGVPTANAEEVTAKASASDGSYCHVKFPAMREETLSLGSAGSQRRGLRRSDRFLRAM